jgi:exodeoxyribonuclease-3
MKIATWNVNSLRPRLEHVQSWVEAAQPDVLCLQETKVVDEDFPHAELEAMGFTHRLVWGQKTYNGVAILSRHPIEGGVRGFAHAPPDEQARIVRGTVQGVHIIDCYVPNGAPLATEKYTYKLDWLGRLRDELDAALDPATDVLLCGDLNIAPEDIDVHDPFEAEGQVLFTPPEKEALARIQAWGLVDAFRKKNPFAPEFSWWDYRGSAFRYNHGWRIDHILTTKSLFKRCRKIEIDRTPRGWDRPSDHTPVIATLKDA